MSHSSTDFTNISQITDHIFISGMTPLTTKPDVIKKLHIKNILSCTEQDGIADIHNKILSDNPDITVMYLPYDDDVDQNLWLPNQDQVQIVKYTGTLDRYNNVIQLLRLYQNKPMIEIGYHFINQSEILIKIFWFIVWLVSADQ